MSIGKSITMSATNMLTEALNITEFYGTTDGVVANIRQRHKRCMRGLIRLLKHMHNSEQVFVTQGIFRCALFCSSLMMKRTKVQNPRHIIKPIVGFCWPLPAV